MGITGIGVFDQNVGMACAKIRFKCSRKSLVYLFDQHVGMECAKI